MRATSWSWSALAAIAFTGIAVAQPGPEDFEVVRKRMTEAKPAIQKKHADLLAMRYDLEDRPAEGVKMSRGKAVQAGPRAKLPAGWTWLKLADLSPGGMKKKRLFPKGFFPLPHPHHPEGAMLFTTFHL